MKKDPQFVQAQNDVLDNLDVIETALDQCVDEGMLDPDSEYHNKLEDLLDAARIAKTWEELMAVVSAAKTFEEDVDTWLSFHGRSTIELSWPIKKEGRS